MAHYREYGLRAVTTLDLEHCTQTCIGLLKRANSALEGVS